VAVVTDATGAVVERYEYGAFGQPTIYAPDLTVRQASAVGNTLMFNGRPYDPETGLYYYRTRYLDPRTGRFTTRDTIGIWGDPANMGNGYAYVGNNPWTMVDPYGMGVGHHYVPNALTKAEVDAGRLSQPAADVFRKTTTGQIPSGHGWSKAHADYSRAVGDEFVEYLKSRNIDPKVMTESQAKEFIEHLKNSPKRVQIKKFLDDMARLMSEEAERQSKNLASDACRLTPRSTFRSTGGSLGESGRGLGGVGATGLGLGFAAFVNSLFITSEAQAPMISMPPPPQEPTITPAPHTIENPVSPIPGDMWVDPATGQHRMAG
jgi:RHS repeat-associated protein